MSTFIETEARPDAHGTAVRLPNAAPTELACLRTANPVLAAQVEHIAAFAPDLAARAYLAGRLVAAGAVSLAGSGEFLTSNGRFHRTAALLGRVRSESDGIEYTLTREPFGGLVCNCADAQPGQRAPQSRLAPHTCVHILALVIQSSQASEK